MKLQKVSLEYIAQLAGVHKATVSRALRNHANIPLKTRTRIQAIATAQGYRPNPLVAMYQAQARSNRPTAMQSSFAWLNDYPNANSWREFPWLRGYFEGARARCEERGFQLEEISLNTTEGPSGISRLPDTLRHRGIYGVVLPLILHREYLLEAWPDCVIALIGSGVQTSANRSPESASAFYPQGVPIADRDFYYNLRLAFQKTLEHGKSRIGFVYSRYLDSESEGRAHAAFLVEQAGLPEAQRVPVLFLERFKEGRPVEFDRWMDTNKPDAILTVNPILREWVEQLGMKIPQDCALVNLNVVDDVQHWAGIRENHELIGASAVDLLIGQLMRNEIGLPRQPRKVLIPGQWQAGTTL